MKYLLYENPNKITLEEFNEYYKQIPLWRKQKADLYKFFIDKVLCVKSFLMLKQLLSDNYNIYDVPEFNYNKYNKPYFANYPNIFFNISHTKTAILCVVSNNPIGCDIESIPTSINNLLCNKVLNFDENEIISKSQNPLVDFTKLWTMKESYLKMLGIGLQSDIKNILSENVLNNYSFSHFFSSTYVASICESSKLQSKI